ncbi:MAG TPA: hypothetical protein VGH77_10000 [Streptosporangiaceae bacterium]|jgi:hypothetical protein
MSTRMTAMPPDDPPAQGDDETDLGWGDHPDPDDDDRLTSDRPPHWDSP